MDKTELNARQDDITSAEESAAAEVADTPAVEITDAPAADEQKEKSAASAEAGDYFDIDDFPPVDYSAPPAIEFEHVSKKYYLYKSDKARFKAMFTNNRGVTLHPALEDISFKVYQGESVGFIGRNGAGKSTILKLITGVSFPTGGDVTVRGKVAAMLELTAGFSPDMTGRENITMKGLLLGLEESDIEEIEDDIIDFAELGEYIDQPVRTYSSGMKMRLGFAININIRPDILVVDEALSVGDARFRKKCRRAIMDLIRSGVTVLFVSHSQDALISTCNRAIYLKNGCIEFDGAVHEALDRYNADVEEIRRKRREKREAKKKRIKEKIEKRRKQALDSDSSAK